MFPFSLSIFMSHLEINYVVGEVVKYRKRESVGKNLKVFPQNRREQQSECKVTH